MKSKQSQKFKRIKIGKISSDWKMKELMDIASYVAEKIHINCISKNNFISTENMLSDRKGIIRASSLPSSGKVTQFKTGDILFSNIRTYFKKLWLASFDGGCSNDVLVIRIRSNDLNNLFLYYFLSQEHFFEYTVQSSKGTKMPRGDKTSIMNYPIMIPSTYEQSSIVKIFQDLDSQIQNLQKQNKILEQIAQTVFKSWFIDYEFPDENGKPYKSSGGTMIYNGELGKDIPKDWYVDQIHTFGKIVCGKTPPKSNKEFFKGDIPFIKIPDMHDQLFITHTNDTLTEKGLKYQEHKTLPVGSICVSCIATVGLVSITSKKSHTNQQINSIIPHEKEFKYYLYYVLKSIKQKLKDMGSGGTTTLNVNTTSFSKIRILYPKQKLIEEFDKTIQSFFGKLLKNTIESQSLKQIQDLILPKLMSGEIRV